jgi:NADPH-dependent 2,4-dienoyl-CoA reductase/sulfur reductase-like enzyme
MSSAENEEKKLTRREFFKGSAAGGAAGLIVGAGGAALMSGSSKPWLPKTWDYEADVVVVGTGYAGQNAAIASHDAGASVLVLEKAPERFAVGIPALQEVV